MQVGDLVRSTQLDSEDQAGFVLSMHEDLSGHEPARGGMVRWANGQICYESEAEVEVISEVKRSS